MLFQAYKGLKATTLEIISKIRATIQLPDGMSATSTG